MNFLSTSTTTTDDDLILINPSPTESVKVMTTITGELDELRRRLMSSAIVLVPTPVQTGVDTLLWESDELLLETETSILTVRPSPVSQYTKSDTRSFFSFTVKQVGTTPANEESKTPATNSKNPEPEVQTSSTATSDSDSFSGKRGNSKSGERENKSDADPDVQIMGISKDPIAPEVLKYYIQWESNQIKQEPRSDDAPFSSEQAQNHRELVVTDSSPMENKSSAPSGKKNYVCETCDKTFSRSSPFKRHRRTHTGEKPYICQTCGMAFAGMSNLKLHLRTHTGEKPYICQTCETEFSDSSALRKHQRIHAGEKPYKCEICDKSFTQAGGLSAHLGTRIHNKRKRQRLEEPDDRIDEKQD